MRIGVAIGRQIFSITLLIFLLLSCQRLHPKLKVNQGSWLLSRLNGIDIMVQEQQHLPSITFDAVEQKAKGFSGCNHFFAGYHLDKQKLSFSNVGMTRRFCNDSAELEHRFANMLAQTQDFNIVGQSLMLMEKNKILAVFTHYPADK